MLEQEMEHVCTPLLPAMEWHMDGGSGGSWLASCECVDNCMAAAATPTPMATPMPAAESVSSSSPAPTEEAGATLLRIDVINGLHNCSEFAFDIDEADGALVFFRSRFLCGHPSSTREDACRVALGAF